MAARIIDAKYSTVIGTPERVLAFLEALQDGAVIVDLKYSNVVLLDEPLTDADLRQALEATPRKQRV